MNLFKVANYFIEKKSYIRKMQNGKYKVLSRKGKTLGVYNTKEEAKKRLQQIEYFKKNASVLIEDADDFTYSAISRHLRKELSPKEFKLFQKKYKDNFDKFYLDGVDNFEEAALKETLKLDFGKVEKKK